MRAVAAVHDLVLALLTGGLAGAGLAVNLLFARAPSREIAGAIGNAIFTRLGPISLGLAAVLLLSPGFDYFRVTIDGLMAAYGDRPAFLAAAEEDPYSAETVRRLAEEAVGPADWIVYPSGGHGTALLASTPDLADRILTFLDERLQ